MSEPTTPSRPTRLHRKSLKRGYARRALTEALRAAPDHAAIFDLLSRGRRNPKAVQRVIARLRGRSGVALAGLAGGEICVVLRDACNLCTRLEGQDVFTEDALRYTQVRVEAGRARVRFRLHQASFGRHALERMVERSACDLGPGFLGLVDREAFCILRQMAAGDLIAQADDEFARARHRGVWAGGVDLAQPDPDWALNPDGAPSCTEACIPVFSARTFLGPDEMKPVVWLRWQTDPGLGMVA